MLGLLKKFANFYGAYFAPKLYESFKAGYTKEAFKKDCISGITITIISIPLAMALAIASGLSPTNGLYTAIIAGFCISVFGGSKYQIGGPTGAFAVVIFNVVAQYSYEGLLLAMMIAGILLVIGGFLRVGAYIKYIPYPVIIGFTSGIAVLLFTTQVKDLLGLHISSEIPAEFLPKWRTYISHFSHFSILAITVSIISFALILLIQFKKPKLPAYLIAVTATTALVAVFGIDIDTIGNKFGDIPHFLPKPHLPDFNVDLMFRVFPSALTIAFLAGVESLLSATVADAISGDNHNPNSELIGEGVANIAAACFMGMPATGAIARTATNVRAGAQSPVSGIMQAVFLLLFLLLLSPLAKFIPLACLSAILILIAYGMFDFPKFFNLLIGERGDRFTLLVTFFLTVFVDLNAAISVGFIMYSIIFMHRISKEVGAEDISEYENKRDISEHLYSKGVMAIRLSGPIFFGGASKVSSFLKKIHQTPRILILRMGNVPYVDISGINVILDFIKKTRKNETKIIMSGIKSQPHRVLSNVLKKEKLNKDISFSSNFPNAVKMARRFLKNMGEEEVTEPNETPKS